MNKPKRTAAAANLAQRETNDLPQVSSTDRWVDNVLSKRLGWVFSLTLLTFAAIGWFTYRYAAANLIEREIAGLHAISEVKAQKIEGWMRENLGPEARVRETVSSVVGSLERLPRLLAETEKTYSMLVNQGLKLHPDTVKNIFADQRSSRRPSPMIAWVIAAALAVALYLK